MSSIYTTEYAISKNTPIIFGSVGYESISAGPLLTSQKARNNYLSNLLHWQEIKKEPVNGSISSTNLSLSSIIATNIITWFYPFSKTDLINTCKSYNPVTMALISEVSYGDN